MQIDDLKLRAKEVAQKAHAPYSNFRVGCALLTKSGNIYVGCNVENASYGLTICAERNAICNAVATEGPVEIEQLVVYTETKDPATPCGACRQTIKEFSNGDTQIHSFCSSERTIHFTMEELLPKAFDLDDHQ